MIWGRDTELGFKAAMLDNQMKFAKTRLQLVCKHLLGLAERC